MKAEIRDKEIQARMFLYHRFGLAYKSTYIGDEEISIENLDFNTALQALKQSYKSFIESKENQEKIYSLILYGFSSKHHRISEKDSSILIHKISTTLQNFYSEHYYDTAREQMEKQNLVIVPLKTTYLENNPNNEAENDLSILLKEPTQKPEHEPAHEHIKAIALFDERLLKINPRGLHKHTSVRIYRVQPYPIHEMETLLQTFHKSFETPLEHHNWDKVLNALTHAEKINTITKKEQNVGNGSWLTAKMLILAVVYSVIYQYCYSKEMKEFESEPVCSHIAEGFYKLFIVDDRNRAIEEYLKLHGFHKALLPGELLSVTHRLLSIKDFLALPSEKRSLADKVMLDAIYLKSLNWLLADNLKKGDIGAAYALIEAETNNRHWNPLVYAAKNGKIAIAELLGSNAKYITLKDNAGNLPLHYAIQNRNDDIFRVFLRYKKKNKLNLLAKNHEGNTGLHLAAFNNELEIIDLLLMHEPLLLNIKNDKDETALKIACDNYNTNTIKKLISKGASLEGISMENYSEEIQTQLRQAGRPTLL